MREVEISHSTLTKTQSVESRAVFCLTESAILTLILMFFSGSNYNSNIQHLPKNKISTRLENFLNKKLNESGSQSESESYHLNEAYSTKLGLISLRA